MRALVMERLRGRPPAHDYLHVCRVEALARRIAVAEGARVEVVVAAALLHELVNLPKSHPDSHCSGDLCAEEVLRVLHGDPLADAVALCVRDHAFSKGCAPRTLEAAVLQDADRLDAIGAIGIARCFATTTEMCGRSIGKRIRFAGSGCRMTSSGGLITSIGSCWSSR